MENSRSLAGAGGDTAQQGFVGITWRHQLTGGEDVVQRGAVGPAQKHSLTCVSPVCSEAYRSCLDEWNAFHPLKRGGGFNDSQFTSFLFIPLAAHYRYCSCSDGRTWVDSVHLLKQVFC